MKRQLAAAVLVTMLVLVLAACNLPAPPPTELKPDDVVNTQAAKTVIALSTELAAGENPTLGPGAGPRQTPTPGAPADPGAPVPSSTPTTATGNTGATVDPNLPCNQASFVRDITVPDDSTILPGSQFVKAWELKNTGSCPWTSAYTIVFAGNGDSMSGPASTPLLTSGEVKPGESVKAAVTMRAPTEAGDYRGSWVLKSPDGKTFGVGENGGGSFFVQIRVADEYFFTEHLCSAEWSTGAGPLPCPGKTNDTGGYVTLVEDPKMEDGTEGDGMGMLTVPQPVSSGMIVGRFPAVMVPTEADLRATIGCSPGASGCYVRFKITYQVDNGAEQTLGEWNEGLDNNTNRAIADLDMLAGKSASFNFYVYVNGTPNASQALWFNPRIIKQ